MNNLLDQLHSLMIAGCLGALSTFILQKFGCSAVIASCLVGLAGALIGQITDSTHLPLVIFAGSFVGMTGLSLATFPQIAIGGLLTGLIYKFSLDLFPGYGGRLGTIAFISTVSCIYLLNLVQQVIFK